MGDTVVVAFTYGSSTGTASVGTITDNLSNTYMVNQSPTRAGFSAPIVIASCVNVTNAPQTISVTINNTASATISVGGVVYDLGTGGTGALDVSTTGTTSNSTALNAAFTAAAAGEACIAVLTSNNGSETYTPNTGFTQDFKYATENGYFFHNTLVAAGANSFNVTASTAVFDLWAVVSFTIPQAQLGTGPLPKLIYVMP